MPIGRLAYDRDVAVEWFRNPTWSEAIERSFDEKLRRARRKGNYLRIQASTLARSCPEVALRLLDRYFQLPDDFDHAQAHVDRATALLALGQIDEATAAYEAALAREAVFPKLLTQACLDLPFLIATRGIGGRYRRAVELLHAHIARLMFPVDHFRWNAARALIAAAEGDAATARTHAARALETAGRDHTGFAYHPTVGLVTAEHADLIERLETCCAG